MHDRGITVPASRAWTLAWLRWGRDQCPHDTDSDVVEELNEMEEFLSATADDAAKAHADTLLADMCARRSDRQGSSDSHWKLLNRTARL